MNHSEDTRIIGRAAPIARRSVSTTRTLSTAGSVAVIERTEIESGTVYIETYLSRDLLMRVRVSKEIVK